MGHFRLHWVLGLSILLFLSACASSGTLQNEKTGENIPDYSAVIFENQPLSETEDEFVLRGIELHDQGNYDEAIQAYGKILEEKPHSAIAIYQTAYAYNQAGDIEKSLEFTKRGVQINSDLRYMMLHLEGVNRDMLDQPNAAIAALKAGLNDNSSYFPITYSIALIYYRMKDFAQAESYFRQTLDINFFHAGSHFNLAQYYKNQGSPFKALLGYSYSWMFDEDYLRGFDAVTAVRRLLHPEIETSETEDGRTTVSVNLGGMLGMDAEDPLGKLDTHMFMLNLRSVTGQSEETTSEMELISAAFNDILETLTTIIDENPNQQGFMWDDYLPLWIALYEQDHHHALIYVMMTETDIAEAEEWVYENEEAVDDLFDWLNDWFDN